MRTIVLCSLFAAGGCQGAIAVEGTLDERMAEGHDADIVVDGTVTIARDDRELVVDRARMMLGELEIEGSTEASEVEVGPEVLELGLDGDSTEVGIADVPAGKYKELGFEMKRGSDDGVDASADFGGSDPASIIVDGTFNGEDFSYRSRYAAELEFGLGDLKVSDGETATVTVTFDVAAWFLNGDGNVIDPSNPDNRSVIDGNIRDSVAAHAEEDDDD